MFFIICWLLSHRDINQTQLNLTRNMLFIKIGVFFREEKVSAYKKIKKFKNNNEKTPKNTHASL